VPGPGDDGLPANGGLSAGREPVCFRHPAVLHRDLTVLDHLERDLVLHFRDTARVLRGTRYYVGWESIGVQMGAYEHALKYAQERLQFGKPIGSFQIIQDLLAKMLGNITACQCMVVRTARLADEGKLTDQQSALSKAFTTAKSRETVSWARELLGGNGILADYNVARFFADAEALYSYEGTYQMQHLIVGKAVTGFSAFV
jgi:alkylation response protein AidB-like acyl-CoA dehydrogenase